MAKEQLNSQHEANGVEITEPELNQTAEPSTKRVTQFSEENEAENVEQKSSNMSNLGLTSNVSRDNQIQIRRKRKSTLTYEAGKVTASITSIIQTTPPNTKRIRVLLSFSPDAADKQYTRDERPFEIQLPDHIPRHQKTFKVVLPGSSLTDTDGGIICVRRFSSHDELPAAAMAKEQLNSQHEANGVEITEPELNQTAEPSTKRVTQFSEENEAENVEQKSSNMSNLGLTSNVSRDNQIQIRRKRKSTLTYEAGKVTASITSIIQTTPPNTKRIRVLLSFSPDAADKQYTRDERPFEIQLPDHIPRHQKTFKVVLPGSSLTDTDGGIICVRRFSSHDELPAAAMAKEQLNSQHEVADNCVEITEPELNQTAEPSAKRVTEFSEENGAENMEQKSSNIQTAPPKSKRFRVSVLPDATDKQYAHERTFEIRLPDHIQRHQKTFKVVLPDSSLIDTDHFPDPTHEIQLP
eukprot:CAMPEP_0172437744 /NCGR_PEP_ID=MMETSP1064-20121228/72423_1 /TAXON_ID=202472 /ORGANISM="Aulacoseira subarctica , Strain CCAP 1002/5" /LENGTH=465 /DNA_ID=CAMNT_0013186243 /DNA_START=1228 /DNA_END=2625 /DNA_ORIENTATION=-